MDGYKKTLGFIGAGNMAQAMIRAFLDSKKAAAEDIFITNRTDKKAQRLSQELGVRACGTNEELIESCDLVFLSMKPQDLYAAIEPIASTFQSDQIVASVAAGISLDDLQKLLPNTRKIIRVMPNTAAQVRQSVVAYACSSATVPHLGWLEDLLASMGVVVPVEDGDMMESITVASSSGVGFLFELMSYWQEWLEERGFEPAQAKQIAVQVFAGASALAAAKVEHSLEELARRVTSSKGVTAAGLESMRELEIERALRISFEKAAMRDKELGQTWQRSR
jgi:pyrroline-5-carboxylate reductase